MGVYSKMKLIVVLLALSLFIGLVVAQYPYMLCGHVYDDEGNLVEGIEVTLLNQHTNETQTFITNEKGEYLIDCLNFKQGFQNGDTITISCEFDSVDVIINTEYEGIQADMNRSEDVDPVPIITGTILVAAASGAYYYIKRKVKSKEEEEVKMEEKKEERPLGLPKGSIRALLAITAIGGSIILECLSIGTPEWLITLDGVIATFYFYGRAIDARK